MEENLKKLAEALRAYITLSDLDKYERDYLGKEAISINLSWIKKLNLISVPFGLDVDAEMNIIREKLIDAIKGFWEYIERVEGVENQKENEVHFIYKDLISQHYNGKKIFFGLKRNNRDLELTKIYDEINPHHDYGFELPCIICGI